MTTAHNARQRLAAKRAEIAAQLADPTVAATTCTLTPIDQSILQQSYPVGTVIGRTRGGSPWRTRQ